MGKKKRSFLARLKRTVLAYAILGSLAYGVYYYFWGQHLYLVTAYCNCPICIDVEAYQDGKFASGRSVFWGGIAADPAIRFGTQAALIPHWPQDWGAVYVLLNGRREFRVEDRGGKVKGKHIDLFIPDSMGGHKTALKWGVRKMRIKLNGEWAE